VIKHEDVLTVIWKRLCFWFCWGKIRGTNYIYWNNFEPNTNWIVL